MERRPIVREAEPLYRALARASIMARRDPGWSYVRSRLDEVTRLYEDLVVAGYTIDCNVHESLGLYAEEVEEAIGKGESEAMRAIIELEEKLRPAAARVEIASQYARAARIIAGLLLVVAGISLIASAGTIPLLALASLTLSMGIAASLLHNTRYADLVLLAGLPPIALYSLLSEPPLTVLIAALGVGLATPLPAALRRLIAGGPGWAC